MKRLFVLALVAVTFFSLGSVAKAYDPLCPDYLDSKGNTVAGWQKGTCTNPNAPCGTNPDSAACNSAAQQSANKTDPVQHTLLTTANVMALLTGLVAVGMIMAGGITMITGGANPERAKKARSMISSAIIGLVIVALSWTIVHFVITRLIK